jgi:hypothetical protein
MKPTARVRHPAPAPDLAERLRAIVGEVTSNVTEQLVTALDELLPSLVRERLELVLDGLTGTPAEPARRARPAPAEPSGAKVPTCSSCGERGHNKRTCGREEAVSTDDADAEADTDAGDAPVVEVKPPPHQASRRRTEDFVPLARPDRFSAIQAAANARATTGVDGRRGSA